MAVKSHVGNTTRHELSGLSKARGVIGREPGPDEEYVFRFDTVKERSVHMAGVRNPLEVEFWIVDRNNYEQTHLTVLNPWVGVARAPCNLIIERGVDE